jgi:hypothetical protein
MHLFTKKLIYEIVIFPWKIARGESNWMFIHFCLIAINTFFFFFFWDRVSLCSPGLTWTHSLPTLFSQVLELKVYATMPGDISTLNYTLCRRSHKALLSCWALVVMIVILALLRLRSGVNIWWDVISQITSG